MGVIYTKLENLKSIYKYCSLHNMIQLDWTNKSLWFKYKLWLMTFELYDFIYFSKKKLEIKKTNKQNMQTNVFKLSMYRITWRIQQIISNSTDKICEKIFFIFILG